MPSLVGRQDLAAVTSLLFPARDPNQDSSNAPLLGPFLGIIRVIKMTLPRYTSIPYCIAVEYH